MPHRAHVPRRAARAGRAADPGRHRRRSARRRWPRCCRCSATTSWGSSAAMDGLPVTVRLIDPPLHEFLPPLEELAVKVAVAQARGEDPGSDAELLAAVRRMHEQNPMLGLRGVRLGLVIPGLFAMQVRAIAEAAARVRPQRRATRGRRSWCRWSARCRSWRPCGPRRSRCIAEVRASSRRRGATDRHDDRGAPGGADRRPDRRGRRVLLLRHQRPDPDGLGLLPRRRGGRVLLPLPGAGHLRRVAVRVDRPGRRRPAGPDRRRARAGPPART